MLLIIAQKLSLPPQEIDQPCQHFLFAFVTDKESEAQTTLIPSPPNNF